jgi:7,8-dihydropterin-6-yl-methyl-4-(beta-D-ribofuranosyl)aminobenzene 5'-phosphate synthase
LASGGTIRELLGAEHGFSALVEIHHDCAARRILFDAGTSRDCLVDNLDRPGLQCDGFEAVVISHGHVDHGMGLEGLARRIGRRHLPVVQHPEAWARRRLVSPSGSLELPPLSRRAVEGAGFAVVEGRRPSFLLDDRLLVTGEVERVTDVAASALPAAFLPNAVGSTFVFTGFPEVQPEGSRA